VHTAQQMPLPLTASCFSKIQMVLPFCYRLTRVVPDKGLLNGCTAVYMNVINVQGVSVYLSNDCALYKSTHSLTDWSKLSIADTTARLKFSLVRHRNYILAYWTNAKHQTKRCYCECAQYSMGPLCVTRANPTHQLTDPTQPNSLQVKKFGPNPIQLAIIGFRYLSYRP